LGCKYTLGIYIAWRIDEVSVKSWLNVNDSGLLDKFADSKFPDDVPFWNSYTATVLFMVVLYAPDVPIVCAIAGRGTLLSVKLLPLLSTSVYVATLNLKIDVYVRGICV